MSDKSQDPREPPQPQPQPSRPRKRWEAMTGLQRAFVHEYLVDMNAHRAAIRAGYSPSWAKARSYMLLQRDDVKAMIAEHQKEAQLRSVVTIERIIAELAKIAFADPRDLFTADGRMKPIHEMDDASAASLAAWEVMVLAGTRSAAAKSGAAKAGELGLPAETVGDLPLELRKIKRWDKTKALELLGRYLGLFKDKVELSASSDLAAAIEAARRRAVAGRGAEGREHAGQGQVIEGDAKTIADD